MSAGDLVAVLCPSCHGETRMPRIAPHEPLADALAIASAWESGESTFRSERMCLFCGEDRAFELPVPERPRPQGIAQELTQPSRIITPAAPNAATVALLRAERARSDGRRQDALSAIDAWARTQPDTAAVRAQTARLKLRAGQGP